MTDSFARTPRKTSTLSLVLTNGAVAVQGETACIDTSTGLLVAVGTSTTLLPIGTFNTAGTGDGATKFNVQLFEELRLWAFVNDTSTDALLPTDIGSECYLKDGRTVSKTGTGRSKAGRVFAIDAIDGVFVQLGAAVTGPTGAAGLGADTVADRAAIAAIAAGSRFDGMILYTADDGSAWRYELSSTLSTDEASELAIEPTVGGVGAWIRADKSFTMKLSISHSTADAAALLTVPTGFVVKVADDPHWEVSTGFTGGTAAAIGVSSSNAAASTKGDLLGGASGDVTATLGTAGTKAGTAGAKMDTVAHRRALLLVAGNTVRFDRITDNFAAGAGYVYLPVEVALV